jgi:hypothetical protein
MDSDVERLIALVREQTAMIREQAARIEELESNLRGYEGAYAALQRATAKTRRRYEAALRDIAGAGPFPDGGSLRERAQEALGLTEEGEDDEQPEPAAP